jgi:PHD/YefM family antitoxin component YafN of YafNO toxin-antitoxin module
MTEKTVYLMPIKANIEHLMKSIAQQKSVKVKDLYEEYETI